MLEKDVVISGRTRDLGGFSVSRTLPSIERRFVGPFVFLDHMGPMRIDATHMLDVRPHPHIGLSTVTYLFEGRGYHRDSLGSKQVITPGDLNWMTAGRGIVHSERTPEEDLDSSKDVSIHGIQIWVALPVSDEECEPNFRHYSKEQLPAFELGKGLSGKLLIGSHGRWSSPVHTYSKTFFADVSSGTKAEVTVSLDEQEIGFFLVSGKAMINQSELKVDDLILVKDPSHVQIKVDADTRLIVVGGTPFPEPRHIWWNFVSSRKERLREAAQKWKSQEMGKVPGEPEGEFIPLPEMPSRF